MIQDETSVPEFTYEPFGFTVRHPDRSELPGNLDNFATYAKAFVQFAKLKLSESRGLFASAYAFRDYLTSMYQKAEKEGTIRYYEYEGARSMDFPLLLPDSKSQIYATFVPDTVQGREWFCCGPRIGGKLNDVINNRQKILNGLPFLNARTDLSAVGIDTEEKLAEYVEEAFLKAAADGTLLQYTVAGTTFLEFPLNLVTRDGTEIITVKIIREKEKWKFTTFCFRSTGEPLEDVIKREEVEFWMKELETRRIRKEEAEAKKQKELEEQAKKEAEEQRKKAIAELIPFREFPVKKVLETRQVDYYQRLDRFAYLKENSIPYIFQPQYKIDIRDDGIIKEQLTKAFAACNPFVDINYYSEPKGMSAELRFTYPGYESLELYGIFTENIRSGHQPWFLDKLFYGDKFSRTIAVGNMNMLYLNLAKLCNPEEYGITSPEDMKEYLRKRFYEAITQSEMISYGEKKNTFAELPLNIPAGEEVIHAKFQWNHENSRWWLLGFYLRPAEDPRFRISDEYKELLENEKKRAERKEETVEIEEPAAEAYRPPAEKEPEKFVGEMIPDETGNPMEFVVFCKEIKPAAYQDLAHMAEEETWTFNEFEPYKVLVQYISERFVRLGFERKIGVHHTANGDDFVAFHTGLFTRDYHFPIYACFKPRPVFTENYNGPKWAFAGFCNEGDGGEIYDKMKEYFPVPPEDANFMKKDGEYLPLWKYQMDPGIPVNLTEEHILRERGYRLPSRFLRDHVFNITKDEQALRYLDQLDNLHTDIEKKQFWVREFSKYLEENPKTYNQLIRMMGYVVQEARFCNARRPIPAYYLRDNKLSWLLPLRFDEDHNLKNLVLIVRPEENREYTGVTIMDIEDLYHKARVVENPDCSWLRREILDNYQFSDIVLKEEDPYSEYDRYEGQE